MKKTLLKQKPPPLPNVNLDSLRIPTALLLLLGTVSCAPAPQSSPATQTNKPTQHQSPPTLESFPSAEHILLAAINVRLEPNRLLTVRAPGSGRLYLEVEEPVTNVEQDFIWGQLEPDALKTEAESLELWREQLETRQEMETNLELPLQRLQVEKKLDEANRTLKMWEMYQKDGDRGRRSMELLGIDPGSGNPAEIERLRWEVELLKTQLQYLQSERPVSDVELQSRRIEWEQRRLDFLKRQEQSRLNAPFNGELRLLIRPQEGRREIWIQSGEDIALMRDLSSAVLRLKPDDYPWAGAPFEDLILKVRIPGMQELEALPSREEIDTSSPKQERIWVFELKSGTTPVKNLPLGAPVSVQLIQRLPSVSKIIPKTTLLFSAKSAAGNWAEVLTSVYPQASLIATGQTELAVETNYE